MTSTNNMENKYKVGDRPFGFSVKKIGEIEERKTIAYEMQHLKSGAKLLYLQNDDEDKAFSISFKTPPADNTGVFHILEHSVLCGSRKFNVKEPFVDLIKSSMATFINAMTFNDKTMYPVSSTNEQDLLNLADVYMDAVLFPNIYKNPNIFYQEGGHKTINSDGKLGFNGVVFNEMTGAYNDPDTFVSRSIENKLFEGSCYQNDSGGFPDEIQKLTYEQFLNEHRSHYRLDNSYIILYGNLNIDRFLEFLDTNYLSQTEEIAKWQGVDTNKKSDLSPRKITTPEANQQKHQVVEMATTPDNKVASACLVYNASKKEKYAINIILDALCSSNESPLKESIIKDNLCEDINFVLHDLAMSCIWIECKKPQPEFSKSIIQTINKKIGEILKDGINPELLIAAIKKQTFVLNENIAYTTHGIDAAIEAMSWWLYDDDKSYEALRYSKLLKELEKLVFTDYFNDLTQKVFIDNKHFSTAEIKCIDKKMEAEVFLDDQKERDNINQICSSLQKWQESTDSEQDIQKLPCLTIQDIGQYTEKLHYKQLNQNGVDWYQIKTKTNAISYITYAFKNNDVDFDDLKYLKVLSMLLGKIDTEQFSAKELDIYVTKNLGNLSFAPIANSNFTDDKKLNLQMVCSASALKTSEAEMLRALEQVIYKSKFNDIKVVENSKQKVLAILKQTHIALMQSIISNGHSISANRSLSYYDPLAYVNQQISGIDFFVFLSDLLKNFDEQYIALMNKINDLYQRVFSSPATVFSNINTQKICNFTELVQNNKSQSKRFFEYKMPQNLNEAFVIPGNVSYAGMAINLAELNSKIPNALSAASKIAPTFISFNYLWNEVRVKGGAYGAGCFHANKSNLLYYSFRDPHPLNSIDKYKESGQWLLDQGVRNKISNKDMTKGIISAVAKFDQPISDRQIISQVVSVVLTQQPEEYKQQLRKQVIDCNSENIVDYCRILQKSIEQRKPYVCLVGNKNDCDKSNQNVIDLFSV